MITITDLASSSSTTVVVTAKDSDDDCEYEHDDGEDYDDEKFLVL